MAQQIGQYRCARCGAVFDGRAAYTNHLQMHEETEPETDSRGLSQAYAHADREFSSARLPIFGIVVLFLATFGIATALRIAVFAPMFVAAVIAMIIGAGFLFKYLLEG
jgi:hypothetical protein